jgi:hypothetical protein
MACALQQTAQASKSGAFMFKPGVTSAIKLSTAAAISIAGLLVLSACDERPYPTAANPPPPPPPPTAELMGAPEAPPPTAEVPPPPAYAPQAYDQGSVVAMAPIPNPGDPGSEPYYAYPDEHHRVHARYYAAAPAPYWHGRVHHRYYAYTPATHAPTVRSAAPAPVTSARAPTAPVHHHVGVAATAAAGAGMLAAHPAKRAPTKTVATTKSTATKSTATTNPTGPTDQAAAVASLQTALSDAVAKTAVLTAPAHFTPNQPAEVSLAIPAGFADTLHTEAQKDGMADQAASVNITALLSGDGYTVLPADTQSGPLAAGQPTTFAWTVTAQPKAKGPLHADVGADLLGGGSQKLTLGSVQPAGAHASIGARAFGIVLLVLLAGIVLIWASTRRRTTTVVRERPGGRPLNMAVDD